MVFFISSLNCPAFFLYGFLSMRFEEIWVEVLGRRRTSAPYLTFRWDFWVLRPMPIFAMCENLLPAAFDDIGAAVLCRIRKRCCCGCCSDVHPEDLEVIRVEVFFTEYRFPLFSTRTALLCVCVFFRLFLFVFFFDGENFSGLFVSLFNNQHFLHNSGTDSPIFYSSCRTSVVYIEDL